MSAPVVEFPRVYNAASWFIDRHLAEGRADKLAFIDREGGHTYGALAERVNRAGNMLKALGLGMEARVAMIMSDDIDFPTLFWGAIKAGIVPIPMNTLLTPADYAYMLADSRVRALVVGTEYLDKVAPLLPDLPFLREVLVAGPGGSLRNALAEASPRLEPAPTTCDDVAFWLYSSGSTGAPKGALHLHRDLQATATLYGRNVLGIAPDDVVFSAAKLFFAYGLGNAMTFPLDVGATTLLLAERPTPQAVMDLMRAHQATIFYGVPTLYGAILAEPGLAGSPRLRKCVSAGEALPEDIGRRWQDRFGIEILDGLGSTEMLHIFLSNRPGQVRYGTSGMPVPGYDCKVVDEDGRELPPGELGELVVDGPSAALCYWNQRDKSRRTFRGQWTHTGDKYWRDEDGFFHYAGRHDDMLKVGGIWVSPFEVEAALIAHESVLEAAVVGQADADGLVKPKAYVVTAPGVQAGDSLAEDLRGFVKARLAPYKYPRWIEFVDTLPKTATGKIQRFRLRAG